MAATTSTLTAITKTFYVQNEVVSQLNSQSVLFDKLMKPAIKDVGGKNYTYAIRSARNRYAGRGISEAGDYGTVGNQGTENVVVPNCEIVTPIELSTRIINAAKGPGKGAFISALKMEVEKGMEDTIRAINRQLHSDGTDALCYWTTADDTTAALVDDGQGNAFPIHLETGTTVVDIIDASDNSTELGSDIPLVLGAEGASSVSVSWASGSISGTAGGDYAVLAGTLGKQMMGIAGVIAATDPALLAGGLHGLAVASYPFWKSQVFSNSGTNRALTLSLLQQPLTQISLRSSSLDPGLFMIGNGFIKNKLIDLLVADQRHVNTTTLKGGQEAVSFNGKPLIEDPQCKRNRIYYVSPKSMDVLSASGGIGWADFDGNQWVKKVGSSGYAAAYQAFITFEGNLACSNRAANALLTDLVDA